MKIFECIAHNGKNGKQIVIFVIAYSASSAHADALKQAKIQFGSGTGLFSLIALGKSDSVAKVLLL